MTVLMWWMGMMTMCVLERVLTYRNVTVSFFDSCIDVLFSFLVVFVSNTAKAHKASAVPS